MNAVSAQCTGGNDRTSCFAVSCPVHGKAPTTEAPRLLLLDTLEMTDHGRTLRRLIERYHEVVTRDRPVDTEFSNATDTRELAAGLLAQFLWIVRMHDEAYRRKHKVPQ